MNKFNKHILDELQNIFNKEKNGEILNKIMN